MEDFKEKKEGKTGSIHSEGLMGEKIGEPVIQ